MPNYPVPNIDAIIDEVTRVSSLQSRSASRQLATSFSATRPALAQLFENFARSLSSESKSANWATIKFKTFLLSLRGPLSESSLAFVLPSPFTNQSAAAAALLRGLAEVYTDPAVFQVIGANKDGKRFEVKQLTELLATTRVPQIGLDEIKTFPTSRHVIVWSKGIAYKIDILDTQRRPIAASVILNQLQQILNDTAAKSASRNSIALLSTAFSRDEWTKIRSELSASNSFLQDLESSITSIALEATETSETSELLWLARGDTGNVYSDKTCGFSVFVNGALAGRVDHTVADGGVVARFMSFLIDAYKRVPARLEISDLLSCLPVMPIQIPQILPLASQAYVQQHFFTKSSEIFDIHHSGDVLELLRNSKLYNITIQLAFQAAISSLPGEAPLLLAEPTSVRHFANGRCDPNYVVTKESLALCAGLGQRKSLDELLPLLMASIHQYKKQLAETKTGAGIGPGIALLRECVAHLVESEDKQIIMKALLGFRKPTAYFTGEPLVPLGLTAQSAVFAPDQIAMTYMGRPEKISMCLTGSGRFSMLLQPLRAAFEMSLQLIGGMTATLATIESMYAERALPILLSYATHRDQITDKGAIVIHAGAGESMGYSQQEKTLVEFILSVVVFDAQQALKAGSGALDVAQQCVVALENCVFFNAGKGAVFNALGKHELEAVVADGKTGQSGAVANTKHIRNPITAARKVLESSNHAFIAGSAADELASTHGIPMVSNEYFSSFARRAQFEAVSGGVSGLNKHPQTVGAVVLDSEGNLAVASSTGGVVNKAAGRIGDTAIPGSGVFADSRVAVACSGEGDAFLQKSVASQVAGMTSYGSVSASKAARTILSDLQRQFEANGGIISLDAEGNVDIESTAKSFFIAAAPKDQKPWSRVLPSSENRDALEGQAASIEQQGHFAFYEDRTIVAKLCQKPLTSGETLVQLKDETSVLSQAPLDEKLSFVSTMRSIRHASSVLKKGLDSRRIALVFDESIKLIPMYGLDEEWTAVTHAEEEFHDHYPGYISSKNGPKQSHEALDRIQQRAARIETPAMNTKFFGPSDDSNLFAKIVRGELEQWRVWESPTHVAFLTPWANTPGYTVLVPRAHLSSDIFNLSDTDYNDLSEAIFDCAALLKRALDVDRVGLIFEGMEVNYAHAKLIPIPRERVQQDIQIEQYIGSYAGFVSSKQCSEAAEVSSSKPSLGRHQPANLNEQISSLQKDLARIKERTTHFRAVVPRQSWNEPSSHFTEALKSSWYRDLFHIVDGFFHGTIKYFNQEIRYNYALTPVTTDCISSPMGLGSDSLPVSVDLFGVSTYLADSMQFTLEYLLRFNDHAAGMYYIAPSFRGEDPDSTHLNQFFHAECELRGDMEDAMKVAEGYIYSVTKTLYEQHGDVIKEMAGTVHHIETLLNNFDARKGFPRITNDAAIDMMPSRSSWEYVDDNDHKLGRKLTRAGERFLIEKYGGFIWLTEMDHLSVPFYQAYTEEHGKEKSKAADLLFGLGETLGLGERHATMQEAAAALDHHEIPHDSYQWYLDIRKVQPVKTSGWGLGSERYLCWLLQHDDVRDVQLLPRLKGAKFLP